MVVNVRIRMNNMGQSHPDSAPAEACADTMVVETAIAE